LRCLLEQSKHQRQEDVDMVVDATGLDPVQVEATWLLFVSTASMVNHKDSYLTKEQLFSTGFLDDVKEFLHPTPIDSLVRGFNEAENGRITFTDFITGLHGCANLECSLERQCDTLLVLEGILRAIGDTAVSVDTVVDAKKLQFTRRYNEMLEAFIEWKDYIPQDKGRRLDVVRGCFIGAENEKVVRALRICYVDYSGLRMAAEIIFKLVNTLMASRKRVVEARASRQ
jgi:hypothetical protein